jgi:hypothetical protein
MSIIKYKNKVPLYNNRLLYYTGDIFLTGPNFFKDGLWLNTQVYSQQGDLISIVGEDGLSTTPNTSSALSNPPVFKKNLEFWIIGVREAVATYLSLFDINLKRVVQFTTDWDTRFRAVSLDADDNVYVIKVSSDPNKVVQKWDPTFTTMIWQTTTFVKNQGSDVIKIDNDKNLLFVISETSVIKFNLATGAKIDEFTAFFTNPRFWAFDINTELELVYVIRTAINTSPSLIKFDYTTGYVEDFSVDVGNNSQLCNINFHKNDYILYGGDRLDSNSRIAVRYRISDDLKLSELKVPLNTIIRYFTDEFDNYVLLTSAFTTPVTKNIGKYDDDFNLLYDFEPGPMINIGDGSEVFPNAISIRRIKQ